MNSKNVLAKYPSTFFAEIINPWSTVTPGPKLIPYQAIPVPKYKVQVQNSVYACALRPRSQLPKCT